MFHVYIIQSQKDGSFYTGMASDLLRRIEEHNASVTKTTRSKKPWKLVYSEELPTRTKARERERYWKSGIGRKQREVMFTSE
jgi:putative endonuclease